MTGDDLTRIAQGYRHFAEVDAVVSSPLYAELAAGVAGDPEVLRFLAELPAGRRQPMLLFATLQYLFGGVQDPGELHRLVVGEAARVRATMLTRATQTNEPARCAALLPVLAGLPGPLTLVEVGASAGLCLYPDRYDYRWDDGSAVRTLAGSRGPLLSASAEGRVPRVDRHPTVHWRAGIDLNPLDVTNADQMAWLRTLV